jgi:hypothetical protein
MSPGMGQNEIQHRFADLTTAHVAAAHLLAQMDIQRRFDICLARRQQNLRIMGGQFEE